ncbi:MAG: hypothetical protein OXC80_09790, partial [Gammaproteobacteria bacterium]|nr:hypothetical protein [Gammaproteobacteria bacterium]
MATSSIYHFFIELAKRRGYLTYSANLEDFEFPESMVAAKSKGSFPDLVLRLSDQQPFSGGELIEIKTSQSYGISSFNSTLPRSSHKVSELSKNIRDQMLNKGEDPDAVPEREIYYLIFGINKRARPAPLYKICLV